VVLYISLMNKHSSLALKSEKRNLKDCCGLPLQKTTTRCIAVTSNESIFSFSLMGQGIACCASIFMESLAESQDRPGAEVFVGFSGIAEMQTEPAEDSTDSAGLRRIATDKIVMLILNAALSAGLCAS
jgi:hypothetical protein